MMIKTKPMFSAETIENSVNRKVHSKEIIHLFKQSDPFSVCTRTEIERILKPANKIVHFSENEMLPAGSKHPDGIYFVLKGRVKVFLETRDSNSLIDSIKGPGEIISYEPVFAEQPYAGKASALEPVSVCLIAKEDLLFLIGHNKQFAMQIIQDLCVQLWESRKKTLHMCYQPVRQRIAHSLLYFNDINRSAEIKTFKAHRTDIARLAGVRRETASRLVSEFEKEGILKKVDNHEISITDPGKLNKISKMYA